LTRSRASERLPEKGFALFEAKPSLQRPGSIEEYPMRGINSGHPAFGGTRGTGGTFFGSFLWFVSLVRFFGSFLWFVSLGKQRNEQKNEVHLSSC